MAAKHANNPAAQPSGIIDFHVGIGKGGVGISLPLLIPIGTPKWTTRPPVCTLRKLGRDTQCEAICPLWQIFFFAGTIAE
jgi:hypothetical protein